MAEVPIEHGPAGVEPVGHEASDRHLKKELSLIDLLFLSVGAIIGSGWLFATLNAANLAGPAVIISWIIAGFLTLLIAFNFAEISGMLPRTGAIVRYPHLTHGSFNGYVLGWTYFLAAVTVPIIEAEAVVTYTSSYIGLFSVTETVNGSTVKVLTGPGIGFAIGLTICFFFLNALGIRTLGKFNSVVTWWKIIIPICTFIFLFLLFNGSNYTSYGGFAPLGWPAMLLAISTSGIVFAFLGFRQALEYGGEARRPQRDVPIATILSVIITLAIYVLLQAGFIGAIRWGVITVNGHAIKPGDWAALAGSNWAKAPLATALSSSGAAALVIFAGFLLADAWISPSGTGWIYTGTTTRTIYGVTVDGYLPKIFQKIQEKTGVPLIALIAATVIGWIFLVPLPSWYLLVGFISAATVLTYVTGGSGLMVLRRTARALRRPYFMPAAFILAPAGFIAASLIVFWSGTTTLNYLSTAVWIGLPIYAWFYAPKYMGANRVVSVISGFVILGMVIATAVYGPLGNNQLPLLGFWGALTGEAIGFSLFMWLICSRERRHEILANSWFLALLQGLYLLTIFGSFGPNATHPPIAFPWDTLICIGFGYAIFYWSVASGYNTKEIQEIVAIETSNASVIPASPTAATIAPGPTSAEAKTAPAAVSQEPEPSFMARLRGIFGRNDDRSTHSGGLPSSS